MDQRSGPLDGITTFSTPGGCMPCNQCIFLRYYKLKGRPLGRPKVLVQADSKDVQAPGDEGSGASYRRNSSSQSSESSGSGGSGWSLLSRFTAGARKILGLPDGPAARLDPRNSTPIDDSDIEEMPAVVEEAVSLFLPSGGIIL